MSLLSPIWLWSLLALPLLAALYFLKVRPRRKPTNAYFLWQQIFQEKSSSAFFRRLRDILSLILMLLAFLLLAFALTNPRFQTEDERDLVIVIDSSASMQAVVSGRSQVERAKQEAVNMARALNGTRQAAVASLDARLVFHSHLSSHPRELIEAIEGIAASDRPLNENAMRSLGAIVAAEESPYRIVFITDGRHDLETYPDGIEALVLDTPQQANVGLIAADMQWIPGRPGVATFYCRIRNSGLEDVEFDFELSQELTGAIAKFARLQIPAGETIEQVYELVDVEAGFWKASILSEDSFELDNTVTMGLNPRKPLFVGIDSSNNWFFENCVRAFARAGDILRVASSGADLRLSEGGVDGAAPYRVIFRPEGESGFWSNMGGPLDSIVPKVLVPEHPMLQHLEVEVLNYRGARAITAPEGSLVIVATEEGVPLIYKATSGGEQAIILNFNPAEADFFLSPWFPVIVHSAAIHLAGREDLLSPVYPTGYALELPGAPDNAWNCSLPDEFVVTKSGGQSIGLDNVGGYVLENEGEDMFIGAALLSEADSLLAASEPTELLTLASGWPIAIWLLVLGLLILTAESVLYHRRRVG